jgi:hypothetical protein
MALRRRSWEGYLINTVILTKIGGRVVGCLGSHGRDEYRADVPNASIDELQSVCWIAYKFIPCSEVVGIVQCIILYIDNDARLKRGIGLYRITNMPGLRAHLTPGLALPYGR